MESLRVKLKMVTASLLTDIALMLQAVMAVQALEVEPTAQVVEVQTPILYL